MKIKIKHINDSSPGYMRKRKGRGYAFLDTGNQGASSEELIRIKSIYIPPAWRDVWISKNPDSHILATGIDQKGRKQYVYHPLWTEQMNTIKFKNIKRFGEALPKIRERTQQDLEGNEWNKNKVLALTVQILDEVYIRIGNKSYEKENGTYGLSNLLKKHLSFSETSVFFEFKAKSGKTGRAEITDPLLVQALKEITSLRGKRVFSYFDNEKKPHSISPSDVNQYLKEISGQDFTAKNFRTWKGTVLAIEKYGETVEENQNNPRKKLLPSIVKKVAEKLGNTASICRNYYIHPSVLSAIEKNKISFFIKKAVKQCGSNVDGKVKIAEIVALILIS